MAEKKFSSKEAIRFGWDVMKANFWFFAGLFVFILVLYIGLGVLEGLTEKRVPLVALIVNLVSMAVQFITGIGMIRITLKLCDNEKPKFSDLFSGFPLFWKYVAGSIVYGLIVVLGILLLIVPGIIWAVKYQYFSYLIVDAGLGPIAAIKKSAVLTKGSKWNLFMFGGLLGLINLLGVLCLLLGIFATAPATGMAMAFVYRKLLAASDAQSVPTAPTV